MKRRALESQIARMGYLDLDLCLQLALVLTGCPYSSNTNTQDPRAFSWGTIVDLCPGNHVQRWLVVPCRYSN